MFKQLLIAAILVLTLVSTAQSEKTIQFASDCTWPPMEFLNSDKEIVGFSVELLDAMGKAAHFKPVITNTAWDGIFAGLIAGKYDAINSSVTINAKRKKQMDFSEPYFEVKQAVIVQKASGIKNAKGLKGGTIGAQIGTTGYFAAKKIKGADAKSYDEVGLAVADLYNGRLQAVVADDAVAADYALQNPQYKDKLTIAYLIQADEPEYLGWAVQKGDKETLKYLNEGLAKVKANGEYDKIFSKWFSGK